MKINNQKKHYADKLVTPVYEFENCEKVWGVKCNLDVCADKNNTKCDYFIDKKINGLTSEWKIKNVPYYNTVVWCNPPHSQTKQWIIKAFYEWKQKNIRIVMLVPINTMTANYFKQFALPYIKFEKKMILNRINFLNPISLKPSKYNSVNGYVTIFFDENIKKRARSGDNPHYHKCPDCHKVRKCNCASEQDINSTSLAFCNDHTLDF